MAVVNIYALEKKYPKWREDDKYVYIGRAGKGMSGKYGNPHAVGHCRVCSNDERTVTHTREESIKRYKADREHKALILNNKEELYGKTLVCFCKPKACHGDVMEQWLYGKQESLFKEEEND